MAKICQPGTLSGKYVLSWFWRGDLTKKEKPLRDESRDVRSPKEFLTAEVKVAA
ncbi:MAG: hypothetical protein WBV23_08905 [Desulfobaccales bacterium]